MYVWRALRSEDGGVLLPVTLYSFPTVRCVTMPVVSDWTLSAVSELFMNTVAFRFLA